jgi:hypothetical protein
MSQQTKDAFIEWIDSVEDELGWTDNKWATTAGLSASVLSKARQGITPKWDACLALANAANRSPITAFRKAGLLPPGPDNEIQFEDWKFLLNQMSPEDEEEMRETAIRRIERRKKEESLKSLRPKKAG